MAERLRLGGHQVVGFDYDPEAVARLTAAGSFGVPTLQEMVQKLEGRKAIWIMVPQGNPVDDTIAKLEPLLNPGDILIDGGNSNYNDTIRRHKEVSARGFSFLDVGTSGGVWGLKEGYSMMIGGEKETVDYLRPIFETLAPAADKGWGRVGPGGSGHFVKMVHNGIEYGLMQAYAEGFTILEKKEEMKLDLPQIADIWRYGSVVRSWLLDLTAEALAGNPTLDGLQAYVVDSGEGRWTVFEAINLNVSAPVITESVIRRIRSREENNFTDRMLAIMRNAFGGHAVKKE
jgi:6-phosphogluconate dehydrogenase